MTKPAEDLLAQAMALPDADRIELAERLLENWQPSTDPDHQAAWEAEIQSRIDDAEAGRVTPIPWRQAIDQIRRGEGDAE